MNSTNKDMRDDDNLSHTHTQCETLFCSLKGILCRKTITVVAGMK